MDPFRSLSSVGTWLLRLTLAMIVFHYFFDTFQTFSFKGFGYFAALGFILFTVLLLMGGFMPGNTLTVLSGLCLFLLSLLLIFYHGFTIAKINITIPAAIEGKWTAT